MKKFLLDAALHIAFAVFVASIIAAIVVGHNAQQVEASKQNKPNSSIAGEVLGVAIIYTIFGD